MKATLRRRLAARKRQIQRRLDKAELGDCAKPVFTASNIRYEMAERVRGLAFGGKVRITDERTISSIRR